MSNYTDPESRQLARRRALSLLKMTAAVLIGTFALGGVGGYLVYQSLPAGRFPVILVALPGLVVGLLLAIPVRMRRKAWFPDKADLTAAMQNQWPEPEAGDLDENPESDRADQAEEPVSVG